MYLHPTQRDSARVKPIRRWEFISLLGSAVAWPLAARAQQVGKPLNIGVLGANATVWAPWMIGFVARLRELGWVEGHTIAIEYRWTEGSAARVSEIGADFLRQNVAVIVTYGGAVAVLKQATTVTPIVFAVAVDPVRGGLVASLAQPGGNVTGMSIQQSDLVSKRLELLREVIPQFSRIAIMFDANYSSSVLEASDVKATARTLGLDFVSLEIRRREDILPTFEALKAKADALYVVSDALIAANRTRIITLALNARLPTILSYRDYVEAGGLMSYGPNFADLFPRAADMVDKILRGTKPSDIPVEQAIKFELAINHVTAKILGLEIPTTLLATADDVIE
jgi:putative tryptophan/tyrosine transport system substrate-binding protein